MVSSLQPPMTDAEHQAALYRRRQALAQIDNAKFSLYHVRAIIVAGVGFFTDAYDIFAVNFANLMIGWAYSPTGALASTSDTALKISTSAGTVCGQVGFGFLADHLGRKRMYGIELILMIVATLGLSLSNGGPAVNFIAVMIFWRVLLGMGVGGDYPLSSIITSEFATVKWRGAMMAAVFANQGFGQFTAALVSFLCTVGFRSAIQSGGNVCDAECSVALDKSWRIIYGFGAVPACFALYFRLTIPETIRYTLDVSKDDKQAGADAIHYVTGRRGNATADDIEKVIETSANPNEGVSETRRIFVPPKASFRDFRHHFGQWKNGKVLLGTAGSWFFLDIAFYGLGLNTSIILPAIGYGATGTVYQQLYNNGVGNLILSCAGLIPGYWFAVATIDTVGRKPLQFGGFAILTVLFCIFGFGFHVIPTGGLFALYCLCNFFQNAGPNTTTFVVPGEVFPTRYRSTAHGLSAGSGKVGAIVAQVIAGSLKDKDGKNSWVNHIMEIFALFMLLGCGTTLLIPETKRKTLEELSGENLYEDEVPQAVAPATETNKL